MVAAHECDREKGAKEFTVEYDNKRAKVVLAYIATSYAAARACGISSSR
jgi:hypothetical protein